jgi:hypothetical protein
MSFFALAGARLARSNILFPESWCGKRRILYVN